MKVETDEQNRGTRYRTCSIAVYVLDLNLKQMDRVRLALSKIASNPAVTVLATGRPTALDRRAFVRLRLVYYGDQLQPSEIEKAIEGVL